MNSSGGPMGASAGPLIAVVGETASGKSALAMEVARRFNGEIIAADSWTVRKHLNIGTAKPSEYEQAEVRHHLLDVVEPDKDFTAAVFKRLALRAINDITSRGKLPIIAGGTGLYVDSVLFDFSFLNKGDPATRRRLNQLTIKELLELIEEEGLDTTAVDIRNKRRLIRLIENNGALPTKSDTMRANTLIIGLKLSRAQLRANIEKRVEEMFRRGLRHEVKELVDEYGWECEALKGIGYREFKQYYDGEASMAKVKRDIVQSTLHLAKRQRTWFKRNSNIKWVTDQKEGLALAEQFIAGQRV